MAKKLPSDFLAGYASDGTNITIPIASLNGLTADEANDTTGDGAEVCKAIVDTMVKAHVGFGEGNIPTNMQVEDQTPEGISSTQFNKGYLLTFNIDATAGTSPLYIEAGAGNNALYIDSSGGNVGMGTSTPVVELHVTDGDSPTLRLEQNGSNGWTPQIWDVAGNETNFFVRDVTNSSKLPFKIKPGAPDNSLFIKGDGSQSTPLPVGFRVDVFAADSGGPGNLLGSRLISAAGATEDAWNRVEFDPPIPADTSAV